MARDDDDDFDQEEYEDEPRARTSMLTVALCVLNVAAAVGFLFLLVLDYQKRQAWSRAIFLYDLKIAGLPLREETEGTSASRIIIPVHRLESKQLQEVYNRRGGQVREAFHPVEEAFKYQIRPEHLTPDVLKDHFQGVEVKGPKGESVRVETLEDEVERVNKTLLADIEKAAKETAAGAESERDKRDRLRGILMSLTRSTDQVEALDKRLQAVAADQLDARLADAAQRRMLLDILMPLEIQRGAKFEKLDDDKAPVKAEDLDNVRVLNYLTDPDLSLKRLQDLLRLRVDGALADKYDPAIHFGDKWKDLPREVVDKRKAIAFLLTTIAQVRKPEYPDDAKDPTKHLLYPHGAERVMAVVGLYEYSLAYQALAQAFVMMRPQILQLIRHDRDGIVVTADGKERTLGGFVLPYKDEVERLRLLVRDIDKENERLTKLREARKDADAIVKQQDAEVNRLKDNLIARRAETAKKLAELERLQKEWFAAQTILRDAIEVNQRLENLIRQAQGLKARGK